MANIIFVYPLPFKIEGAALKLHQRIIAVAQRNRTQAEELCVFVSCEIDCHPF